MSTIPKDFCFTQLMSQGLGRPSLKVFFCDTCSRHEGLELNKQLNQVINQLLSKTRAMYTIRPQTECNKTTFLGRHGRRMETVYSVGIVDTAVTTNPHQWRTCWPDAGNVVCT